MERSNVDLDCCRIVLVFQGREKSQRRFIAMEMMGTEDSVPRYLWLLLSLHPAQGFYQQQEIITTNFESLREKV